MGLFKKLGRGLKKVVKKNQGGFKRLVKKVGPGLAMAAVGATAPALVVKAASAAKTLGKKVRGLETPKSLVPIIRAAEVRVKKTRSKMPGGAPMPPMISTPSVGVMRSTPQAKRSLYRSANPRTARGRKMMRDGGIAGPNGNGKKKRAASRKPPSAKQLAARAKFAAAAKARRAKKAA